MTRIPITKPLFGAEELTAVQAPIESGWVVQGPFVEEFERRFARFAGVRHALAASSGTTALHLALAALGAGPGDEVIVPAFTWIATANAVEYVGATPAFCDIDSASFNATADAIESCVTGRTAGVIPVHLFGLCADMPRIAAVAKKRSLWVIEDAACAFGARLDGRHAGTFGEAGCFSFHPRKAITTGEGGMVTTGRADLAERVASLRDHGASRRDGDTGLLLPDFPRLGFNYRLTDIQGALGCAQMDRADAIITARRRLAARYDELLAGLDWLERPAAPPGYCHAYQAYVCTFRPEPPSAANLDRLHRWRNQLMANLEARGIATRQGTHAPVLAEYYARKYRLAPDCYPNAVASDRLTLALPLYPQMTDDQQVLVVAALADAFRTASPRAVEG